MSALAGVRWFDDCRQATMTDVRGLLGRLAHRGPDGLCAAISGPCAMGVAHFITTPEARTERQPVTTPSGLTVSFDGRLDNADELRRALGATPRETPADVEVVAAAWDYWGVSSVERLIGDFAVAVWDSNGRRLWLARDVFGLRPLLYRAVSGGFWWASELQTLARLGHATLNHGVVAEYLATEVRSQTETLVEGISRVPRATVVTLTADREMRTTRYWSPRIDGVRRFRNDGEAVEEFRGIFAPAVRTRMRSERPIALTLSGGLDSSLIAVEAALHRGDQKVFAFTLASPGHPADETPYAEVVAAHAGMPLTVCVADGATLPAIIDDAERTLDIPQPPNSVAANTLSQTIQSRGFRVCLNGVGGNEWFSGYHFPFADMLRQFRWLSMAERMRAFARETPSYRAMNDLRVAIWLQLPAGVKRRLRRLMALPRLPEWINPTFADRVSLAERLRTAVDIPQLPTHQLRLMFEAATCADQMFFTEYGERISAKFGCEERSPFLDRRLAEWALALPDDQRWRNGEGKVLLRHTALRVLPAAIAQRGRGPDFSFQTADGLRHLGGEELIMSIARERDEWVVPASIERLWRRMTGIEPPGDRGLGYYSWALWMLVGVHLAARAIERHGSCPPAHESVPAIIDCTIPPISRKEAV
jgi:asparagine synthase (glutamine-hydrolysing)